MIWRDVVSTPLGVRGTKKGETGKTEKIIAKRNGTIFLVVLLRRHTFASRLLLAQPSACNPSSQYFNCNTASKFLLSSFLNMIWNWALLALGALPFCTAQQTITVRYLTVSVTEHQLIYVLFRSRWRSQELAMRLAFLPDPLLMELPGSSACAMLLPLASPPRKSCPGALALWQTIWSTPLPPDVPRSQLSSECLSRLAAKNILWTTPPGLRSTRWPVSSASATPPTSASHWRSRSRTALDRSLNF